MEITSLTVLVDILDAGNLSQAARNLKMTRANVSYHLSQLEKSVGVQLVRRTTRRVEPTEVGLRLYQHGRAIQNEMRAARETIATLGQGLQGEGETRLHLLHALSGLRLALLPGVEFVSTGEMDAPLPDGAPL